MDKTVDSFINFNIDLKYLYKIPKIILINYYVLKLCFHLQKGKNYKNMEIY